MAILILFDRISKTFHFHFHSAISQDNIKSVHLKTKVKMTNGVSRSILTRGKTSRSSRMRGNRNDRFESAFCYVLAVLWRFTIEDHVMLTIARWKHGTFDRFDIRSRSNTIVNTTVFNPSIVLIFSYGSLRNRHHRRHVRWNIN